MSIFRGALGAIVGALRGTWETIGRVVGAALQLGQPSPTPEVEETRGILRTIEQEAGAAAVIQMLQDLTAEETVHLLPRLLEGPPDQLVIVPELLPRGAWRHSSEGLATFRMMVTDTITGELQEVKWSVKFDQPDTLAGLMAAAIASFKEYEIIPGRFRVDDIQLLRLSRRAE